MIEKTQGNLLETDVEALVNPVNTVGVMGKGLALQVKKAFPESFQPYKKACDSGSFGVGQVLTCDNGGLHRPRYVTHLPTKEHWRNPSRLEWIESGLEALVAEIRRLEIASVAVPPLGCGLGGLRWEDVLPRIGAAFAALPEVRVLVYEPAVTGHDRRSVLIGRSVGGSCCSSRPALDPPPRVRFADGVRGATLAGGGG